MRFLFGCILILALSSCASAQLVRSTYSPKRSGIVKHSNEFMFREASEEKSKEIMAKYCGAKGYTVTQHDIGSQVVGYSVSSSQQSSGNMQYTNATAVPVSEDSVLTYFECN